MLARDAREYVSIESGSKSLWHRQPMLRRFPRQPGSQAALPAWMRQRGDGGQLLETCFRETDKAFRADVLRSLHLSTAAL